MASRSFKPSSYLQSPKLQASRPPFARTSSASSTHSDNSDDSIITGALKGLQLTSASKEDNSGASSGVQTPGKSRQWPPQNVSLHAASGDGILEMPYRRTKLTFGYIANGTSSFQSFEDTPGRKRSAPIAIQRPVRNDRVYTPLSARGDLPG